MLAVKKIFSMCSVMMLLIGCLAAAPKAYISKEIPRGGASLMIKAKAVAPAVLAVEPPQEIFVWSTWTNTPFNVFVSANGTQWDYVQTLQPGDYVDYTVPSNQPQTFFSATPRQKTKMAERFASDFSTPISKSSKR